MWTILFDIVVVLQLFLISHFLYIIAKNQKQMFMFWDDKITEIINVVRDVHKELYNNKWRVK